MNDDDLLFSFDDLERWKRQELPSNWLDQRWELLCRRLTSQCDSLRAYPPDWDIDFDDEGDD